MWPSLEVDCEHEKKNRGADGKGCINLIYELGDILGSRLLPYTFSQ